VEWNFHLAPRYYRPVTWSIQWSEGRTPPRFRCLPDPSVPVAEIGRQGWRRTDLLLPALTLRASAVEHNVARHAKWCTAVGVSQAPHAKTHLSPELVRLQLAHGAWGMTAASVHQARLLAAFGVRRIILAHEVVDPANVRALVRLTEERPDLVVIPLVDSRAGVAALDAQLRAAGATRALPVLVELGLPGGRTGARTEDELVAVAHAVHDSARLRLVGVEGFEGILPARRDAANLSAVDAYLARLAGAAARVDAAGLFAGAEETGVAEILITAGGSVFPDRVAAMDRPRLSRPVRVVVRSGGTVTHDHGPDASAVPLAAELRPALDLWAAVVSTPEPGLALVNAGKRDAPYDSHLPVVLDVLRDGTSVPCAGVYVRGMNDQHGYLAHGGELRVGDVVRLGPCHPCTAFDRWPLIPVLDDADAVIGAVTTWF
jgi:D-serine deaminase-like pyridoxal phosphate-dependent protein